MSESDNGSYMCICGHILEDHIKFESVEEGKELEHKCNGKTNNDEPCPCKSLSRA